jgi:uncharacterized membrane protein
MIGVLITILEIGVACMLIGGVLTVLSAFSKPPVYHTKVRRDPDCNR